MRYFFHLPFWTRLSLATSLVLAGCASEEEIEPAQPCASTATVRFCYGNTAVCATAHTTLELADGSRVLPTGQLWEAYLPKQKDGQLLRVSYAPVARIATDAPATQSVTLSCLEELVLRCGNE
jgi:hypothetical protein